MGISTDYSSWSYYPEFSIKEPETIEDEKELELEDTSEADTSSLNSEMGDTASR